MKWLKVVPAIISLVVIALPAERASAQTVQTFEDYSPCANSPVGLYGSVNYAYVWTCYSFVQPPYNPHSPPNRVYTGNPAAPFYFTGGPVTFNGAWFAGYSFATVTFKLFLGAVPVWTSGTLAPSGAPTFLSSGYSGSVDQVQVLSPSPGWYIMDDVTFNGSSSTVPEPASVTLIATGLIGILGAARRRFSST